MAGKLCPKIILEGTRLTLKTEIAFALNENEILVGPRKYRYHSPVISAEWCAFTNFPWGRGLINFEPGEEERAMETYHIWCRLFELQRYYSWIIDRFHISTKAFQLQKYEKEYNFNWLEERLHSVGFHLVFLTRSEKSFSEARNERLKVSGNPLQYNDLNIFIKEQTLMKKLIDESILPKIEVDISDNNISNAVNKISGWLQGNGGLYSKE